MDMSDIISLLALLTAVATGAANYLYTKKAFEASHKPVIQVTLGSANLDRLPVRLICFVRNLSPNVTIYNLEARCTVTPPRKRFQFGKRPSLTCKLLGDTSVESKQMVEKRLPEFLEDAVLRTFPHILQKAINRYDVAEILYKNREPNGKMTESKIVEHEYIKVVDRIPLQVIIEVTYTPAVHNARKLRIVQKYNLFPCYDLNSSLKVLQKWELQKL